MKILLANSPYRVKISKDSRWPEYTKSGTLYYPFWLAYATSVIMEEGNHKPLLIDAVAKKMSFEETIKKAEDFDPGLVVLETSTPTVHNDIKFADFVKERLGKDVKIAMSGTLASSMPFDVMRMSNSIDFVLRGEFDYTVEDLANALEKGSNLKKVLGITFRDKGSIYNTPPRPLVSDLDKIPFVSKAYKKFLNVFDYRYALARYPMLQTWSCYDEKTEVLTKDGWKFFNDLNYNDEIATLHPETFEIEYHKPMSIFSYNYSGKMYSIKTTQIDLLITPNHKVFWSKHSRNYEKKFQLTEIEKIQYIKNIEFKKDGKWNGKKIKYFYLPHIEHGPNPVWKKRIAKTKKLKMNDFLEFLGYYLAEGCTTKKSNNRWIVKISQNESSKIFKKIENVIKRLGFNYTILEEKNRKSGFEISNKQLFSYLSKFGKAEEKFVPKEIKELCPDQLKILLMALLEGDGNLYKGVWTFISSSKKLIDDVQEILLKVGLCGNVRILNKKNTPIKHGKYFSNYDVYRITINHCKTPRLNYNNHKHIRKTFYSGKIYCCEVQNHIIYVRRNGKVCWSGNSRGCPARCNFCLLPQSFTMHQFRMRSPENVVDEMEYIHENLPQVKEIFFEDDTFTINQQRVLEICKEIKERGLHDAGFVWSCNVRVQTKYETLKAMKDAGCRIVIVGYESGNQQVLNNIRKGATIQEAKRFTLDAKRVGLRIFGCFMIGLSGDTKDSIMDTLKLAKEMNPDMAFFQQAVPFPGTEFYEWAKTNGYLVTEKWDEWLDKNGRLRCLVSYPWLTAEEIDKLRDKLMLSFYTNPKHIAQTILKNLHPLEASRVSLYALEYFKYLLKRKINPDGIVKENFVGDNTIPS